MSSVSASSIVTVGKVVLTDRKRGRAVEGIVDRVETEQIGRPVYEYRVRVGNQQVGYLDINKEKLGQGSVYIEYMNAEAGNGTYRGIGMAMHQIALEESLNRFGAARASFESEPRSIEFHFKAGYRLARLTTLAEHVKFRDDLLAAWEDPEHGLLPNPRMHLPDAEAEGWLQRIRQAPVLFATTAALRPR
jgi:hypothetical protein